MEIDLERVINWFADKNNQPEAFSDTQILYKSTLIRHGKKDKDTYIWLESEDIDEDRPCFGDVIDDISLYIIEAEGHSRTLKTTYTIYKSFRSTVDPLLSKDGTWMTKEELENHLNYPKRRLGLEYDFEIKETKNIFKVVMEIHSNTTPTLASVKFILFWFRYAFEYPYNLFIVDAYILKEKKLEYKDWDLISLVQLTNQLFPEFNVNFPPEYLIINVEKLEERLKSNEDKYRYETLIRIFHATSKKNYSYGYLDQVSGNIKKEYDIPELFVNKGSSIGSPTSNAVGYIMNENRFKAYNKLTAKLWR